MPISVNVDTIGSASNTGSLSPLVRNNYRLVLIFPPVGFSTGVKGYAGTTPYKTFYSLMAGGDSNLANDLNAIGTQLGNPQNSMPLEVEFSPPNLSTETRKVRRGNMEIKYAGFPDVGECSCTLNNFVELQTSLFLRCWYQLTAGINRTPKPAGAQVPGHLPFISRVSPALYKVNGYLYQYGHQSTDSDLDQLVIYRAYELYGVYPSTLTMGAIDNSNTGDMQELKLQFAMDYFQPDSSGSTYSITTLSPTDKTVDAMSDDPVSSIVPGSSTGVQPTSIFSP